MLWVKLEKKVSSKTSWLIAHGNSIWQERGWSIRATNSQVVFRLNDGKLFGRRFFIQLHDGEWHHVAMAVDRSNTGRVFTYIDGSDNGSVAGLGGNFNSESVSLSGSFDMDSSQKVSLGVKIRTDTGSLHNPLQGSVDGVAYYHSVIPQSEIEAIAQGRGQNRDSIVKSVCPSFNQISAMVPPSIPQNIANPLEPPPSPQPPPLQFNSDPCRCSEDGFSGSIDTKVIGCSIRAFFGDLCYVQEPDNCFIASPSTNFFGAKYRRCDLD